MKSLALQKEYLVADKANALLNIKVQGTIVAPQTCAWKAKSSELVFTYPQTDMVATVKVKRGVCLSYFRTNQTYTGRKGGTCFMGPIPYKYWRYSW